MSNQMTAPGGVPAWLRALVLAAALTLFVLIITGGIVRVTEAGGACPDLFSLGPCLAMWDAPAGQQTVIDLIHRLTTILAAPLVAGSAWLAWRHFRSEPWIARPLYLGLTMMVVQILLGAAIALGVLPFDPQSVTALHLLLSLLTLAPVLVSLVVMFYLERAGTVQPARLVYRSPFARLSLLTLLAFSVLLLTGALVSGGQASTACPSWPLCDGLSFPQTPAAWLNVIHRLVVAVSGGLLLALFLQAWRTQRTQTPILVATTAAVVLFISQGLLGARLVNGFPVYMLALHQATAVAALAALVVQVTAVGMAARSTEEEMADAASIAGRKGLWKDLLALTKPVVVLLLLVTTYAGMVIGAQAWPSLSLTFWTLLGGFMAAGGSGAINQYIDRLDDVKMQRTQKRPIPAGRLTPGEGLAFGVGIALASFYLMVAFVNFLAALLSLAGILYYVLLYSIILKKTTVQNIVIGGGAGAIPPLVGWAAATGSLDIPSLFLFALVFMWTPPHFWALAIVRRKDYARAGVPMLPVVRGEAETRRQIFIYTIELVALTLLMPLFGLGGGIYLIGALLLGLWLLHAAWMVWKQEGNKVAWKMYRYSSMYLAFIFVVLMIDRLL